MRWPSLIVIGVLCAIAPLCLAEEEPVVSETTRMEDADPTGILAYAAKATSKKFVHGFVASFAVILVSEIGDKTFFIAAIMAMTMPRFTVFVGALGALAVMTVMSSFMGFVTTIVPRWVTYYTATGLLGIFGVRMLREGWYMSEAEGQEEMDEVTQELKAKQEELEARKPGDVEAGSGSGDSAKTPASFLGRFLSPIFIQAFVLTFLAEWGDRSQVATIILAAREDPVGVTVGGVLGHAICTGGAVLGGRLLAQRISVRTVTLVGGVVFILFCIVGLLRDPNE